MPKQHRVSFVLGNYPWAWALPWSIVDMLSGPLLEKTDCPFTSWFHFQIVYWWGLGPLAHCTISLLEPEWCEPAHSVTVSVNSYGHQSVYYFFNVWVFIYFLSPGKRGSEGGREGGKEKERERSFLLRDIWDLSQCCFKSPNKAVEDKPIHITDSTNPSGPTAVTEDIT